MNIRRQTIPGEEGPIPCVQLIPEEVRGAVVVIHGIGGCKEEQLGLAWRLAEMGLVSCAVDLRGHGENPLRLDEGVVRDVEAAIRFCSQYGNVICCGYSLGGRLALISSAEYILALSPAVYPVISPQTAEFLKNVKSHRFHSDYPVSEVFDKLALWQPGNGQQVSITYGSRDSVDIIEVLRTLKETDVSISIVENALHGDIFLQEETYRIINRTLENWGFICQGCPV